jgi:hypothetical protein
MASVEIPAPRRYEGAYPHMSAARPSTGCVHTPPLEPMSESNERMVARWRDGMSPFK